MNILRLFAISLTLAMACVHSEAAPLSNTDMINNWTHDESPSRGSHDGLFYTAGDGLWSDNTDAALISDFTTNDFIFSFRVMIPWNTSDNDTVGVLFGYQDAANHYRVGMEKGGSPDGPSSIGAGGTDARGIWLVREQAGVGTILFNHIVWWKEDPAAYEIIVSRSGAEISFSVTEVGIGEGLVASFSIVDSTFESGHIGIYTESQRAWFNMFDFVCAASDDYVDNDQDGIPDSCDLCPLDAQNDADEDGICGDVDNCQDLANADQIDTDGDGFGDACDANLAGAIVLSADANMINGLDPGLTSEAVSDLAIRPSGAPQFFENLLGSRSSVFVDQYPSGNRGVRGGNEQIRNFYSGIATVDATSVGGDFSEVDLQGVDLLISNVPNIAHTDDELAAMSGLLAAGGTIMFLGGEGQNFDGSTQHINAALSYLGSSMALEDGFLATNWPLLTSDIAVHPLTTGVDVISIAVSGSIANGTPLAFWTENQVRYTVLAVDEAESGPCASMGDDVDEDSICGNIDNCPNTPNLDQADWDGDLAGDACDTDDDNDGVPDVDDNCPFSPNPLQQDADGDGSGDVCDLDRDGDGVPNIDDNCPAAPNPLQEDLDSDGLGDACDDDDDNDGVPDIGDNCPVTANVGQEDLDSDGIGDACDADLDGDGIINDIDNCPINPNVSQDNADLDDYGDACDDDDDNDGVFDESDNCQLIANTTQSDTDEDGLGDACDTDLDGDGVDNSIDNCPNDANPSQNDLDGDGLGDACDGDIDNDGVGNTYDECAATPIGDVIDPGNGCSIEQLIPCKGPRGTTTPWKNHGKFVSATAHAANDFLDKGLITDAEKDAIMSAAGASLCGQK